MSLWQPEAGEKAVPEHKLQSFSTRKQRARPRRGQFGLLVTLLEERILLSTPTLTTLAVSSSSLTYGQSEMLTATVTTNPPSGTTPTGGLVTFKEGSTTLGTATLTSGTAILNTTALAAGTDSVSAVYGGTTTFTGSTSATGTASINTVAGGGNAADRQALYTGLSDPAAVAVDSTGDLFIADTYNNIVREVKASTGAVTIVAGDGTYGYTGDNGQATAAELANPADIVLNGSGDLYIADTYNNVIREVNLSTGIITTVAGTGTEGHAGDNGAATAAELSGPEAVD